MKKICLLLLLLMTAVVMSAEVTNSIGFHIGYAQPTFMLNSPKILEPNDATKLSSTPMNGIKVGVVYDETIIKGFGFSLGLNYTFAAKQSGWSEYNFDESGNPTLLHSIEYSTNSRYHQGELFIDWQYKFEIAKNTYVLLYTGPSMQIGSYTSTDYYRYLNDGTNPNMVKTIESFPAQQDTYLRKFNITWGVGAGFQYERFFLRGGYDFGIINPYKKVNFDALGITGDERWTRGRLDQWQIKIGMYLWQF